ncbi:urease accessory protein UreD [Pseudomonas sp. NP21570]|uniref:urease accessory protein UreD n=1 Tax=unclassified Pseudomonas TaxID=196821 RepID=UPI0018D23930|nr:MULTISPECIES: urease accessory protein UreD [unclassified Pseudomonas]MBC8651911.1 hypothetical protein [Pseudomonas sp. MT4]MCB4797109.1 urease accessory protein UreD [Pseudomonas sp. NP21570]QXY91745.1 hypothetical protein GYM54_09145 [Pseudomonas sp. MTM4]
MGNGVLSLRFARDRHGRTRLAARQQRYPLTTTAVLPMESESGALIYVQNAAGSVFGGDRLHIAVHLEASAELCLSTPSATRLQGEALSVQTTMIELSEGAFFEYIPDMIIPHAQAEHRQHTCIALANGAEAIFMESFAAGRVARGEEHLYRSFSTRLQVSFSARPVLVDASSFRPGEASPALEGALASSGFVGTIFALSQQGDHEELATLISRRLASLPGVYGGAAALASGYGAVGRFLADDAPNLRMATQVAWDVVRRHMRGRPAPLLRK